jgi:NitT/TauT family transport system substrate-binding protein
MRHGLLKFAAFAGAVLANVLTPAQAQEKVVMGLPAPWTVQAAYFHFGEKLGFFREEGLTLDKIAVTGSAVLLPQVASGQVQFGYANPDLTIIAAARNEPLPVKFVANWLRSQTFEFVTLQNSPIQKLEDLKGKKLAVGALTWGNIPLTRAMLSSAGLGWNRDVEVLATGIGAAAWRRLQTGEVDAANFFVGEHGRMELAGIPIRRIPMPEQFRTIFSNGIVTSDRLIAEKPRVVEGFGRALVKSWIACRENPEACVRSYWEATPAARPTADREAEQLRTDMRQVLFDRPQIDDFAPGAPQVYGAYPEDAWRRLIGVMAQENLITRTDLDLSRLYTNLFVEGFNRFDREAVSRAARAAR